MASDKPGARNRETSDNPTRNTESASSPCKSDDDDVQFVSCKSLPRSTGEARLLVQENTSADTISKESSAAADRLPYEASNHKNTESHPPSESYNIGHDEKPATTECSEALRASPPEAGCASDAQIPSSSPSIDSYSGPASSGPLSCQIASVTPWTDFLYADQPDAIFKDWRPIYFGDSSAERRIPSTQIAETALRPEPDPQVSPKTVHRLVQAPPRNAASRPKSPVTIESVSMNNRSQITAQNSPMGNIWPGFEYELVSQNITGSPALQAGQNATDLEADETAWPMVPSFPQNLNNSWISAHQGSKHPQPVQTRTPPLTYAQNPASYGHLTASQSAAIPKTINKQQNKTQPGINGYARSASTVMPQTIGASQLNMISKPTPFCRRTPQPPHLIQARTRRREDSIADSRTQSNDLLRRPSLYSIPAWPAPTSKSPTPVHSRAGSRNRRASGCLNINSGNASTFRENTSPRTFSSNPLRTGISNHDLQSSLYNMAPMPSSIHHLTRPMDENRIDHAPRKRARHEYSPNLIVDIAETCQELFPFAQVAARHNKPIQKVYDTFSAIIQIPLLRNADDKRRHGSLGKRRVKEFRDAKKAREKAHDARRKEQFEAGAAYGAEGTSNAPAGGAGLLRAAVLNNVRRA